MLASSRWRFLGNVLIRVGPDRTGMLHLNYKSGRFHLPGLEAHKIFFTKAVWFDGLPHSRYNSIKTGPEIEIPFLTGGFAPRLVLREPY
jgi:hypothetical protein